MNDTFMKEKPIFPLLTSMALPMVISMLVSSLYNIVDSLFVARISEEASEQVRDMAVKVYRAIGCQGLSRVDFFVTDEGKVVFNEINTIPGFTSISMYPKLFGASGIPYGQLIDQLLELALEA